MSKVSLVRLLTILQNGNILGNLMKMKSGMREHRLLQSMNINSTSLVQK